MSTRIGLGLALAFTLTALDAPYGAAEAPSGGGSVSPAATTPDPAEQARRAQVVAKVGSEAITIGEIEDQIAAQPVVVRGRYEDPAELRKLLDNSVRFELLADEAQRRGLSREPSVVRTVKESAVQGLMREEVDERVTPGSVPSTEVKAYFDGHADEFQRPALRRASHVLFDSEKEAREALSRASSLDQQAFSELAKKESKDTATKLRGGDLGYFARVPSERDGDAVDPALRKAAFELKSVGDIAPKPVPVGKQFSIVRLTGERPERRTTLAEAESSIRTRLWREKRQDAVTKLVERLRGRDKVETFPDRVDLVKLDDMEKGPGGFSPEPSPKGKKP